MISNDQNISNDRAVLELISNHWGLNPASIKAFEKALLKKEYPQEYKKFGLDEHGRMFVEVTPEVLQECDEGWKVFVRCVSNLDENLFGIDFKTYFDGRLIVKKQAVRLSTYLKNVIAENFMPLSLAKKKALYLKAFRCVLLNNWEAYVRGDRIEEDCLELVSNFVDNLMERIGEVCFPKKKLYLVLSCNFADWLLCSTGETWSSCLDLNGDYSFWSGLPSLILDKNRAMVYLTSGKMKTYKGITVPHIHSRSWLLLTKDGDGENGYNFVKEYPKNGNSLEKLASFVLKENFIDNYDFYESKYKIKLLYATLKKARVASSIFLDSNGLEMEEQEKGQPKFLYSGRGETGRAFLVFKKKKYTIDEDLSGCDDIFETCENLTETIAAKRKVFDYYWGDDDDNE